MMHHRTLPGADLLARSGFVLLAVHLSAAPLPVVHDVEWQPLAAQVKRITETLDFLGWPFTADERKAIDAALQQNNVASLQEALDGRCLFGIHINPEMRVKVAQGPAKPELLEQGWRTFLVKVNNESGTTARLQVDSPNAKRLHGSPADEVAERWLEAEMF